ncbi:MAG: thiamine pyrophosphate-dependent enzyme [Acetobacteraceae bacterium]
MRMNTAEAVVESLIRHGISVIFGVPGAHNDPFFDALQKNANRIRTIHTRHEQTAGYMALGAALASGKPQALIVVPGPGMLNVSAALLTAYSMNVPLLALIGQIQQGMIDRGFGYLHEIHDQLGVLSHYTKHAARISHPAEAGERVAEALAIACSGRPRPVVLECARDVWPRTAEVIVPPPRPVVQPPLDHAVLARAAEILGRARKPLIVVGGGATDAGAEVSAIAEALEAPVVSYRRGRGVISTTHRLALALPEGHRLWRDVDVVLGIGTRLFPYLPVWGTDANLAVVRIDIDAEEAERFASPAVAIIADAALALRALLPLLPRTPRPSREAELQAVRAWFASELEKRGPQMQYLAAIRRALPADGIFVGDVTQLGYAAYVGFPVSGSRRYLSAGYQHNLGWSFGAALGAKIAKPTQPVVCVVGDGGFLYQANEFATAIRHNIAVIAVVVDDGAYGNVRRIQELRYGNRLIASDLSNPDFLVYAKSFGVAASRAATPQALEAALREAIALGKPALIHVPVGPMPDIWDLLGRPRVRGT